MKRRMTFAVVLVYLWAMMILLGGVALETFMIYPNVFHDVPESLDTAMRFMAVTTPQDYFPPLGFACWLSGSASLALTWSARPARYWVLGSVIMIVADGLFSMAFFWPRNRIMFIEGPAVHPPDVLRDTAWAFQAGHWGRLALSAVGSALIFIGFLKLHRPPIESREWARASQLP